MISQGETSCLFEKRIAKWSAGVRTMDGGQGIKWYTPWGHRSGECPESLLTAICCISYFLSNHFYFKGLQIYSVAGATIYSRELNGIQLHYLKTCWLDNIQIQTQ
jgi:hypothetical protein